MIQEYHRPKTLEDALALLARPQPTTVPLGGGTVLNRPGGEPVAVVDLQALPLNSVRRRGGVWELGPTLTLAALAQAYEPEAVFLPALQEVVKLEANAHLRQVGTLAGALVSATGRSPLATALLALEAMLVICQQGSEDTKLSLGELLPLRAEKLRGALITRISLPLNVRLAYEYVARTPQDQPIVCAAAAQWPSGRTRLALGGYGSTPALVLDGTTSGGAAEAAADAYSQAADAWASAEYRREAAGILAQRCLQSIKSMKENEEPA